MRGEGREEGGGREGKRGEGREEGRREGRREAGGREVGAIVPLRSERVVDGDWVLRCEEGSWPLM